MSANAQKRSAEILEHEQRLDRLNTALRAEMTQTALDVAGTLDPTPISDVAGAAYSLWRGDFIGAGLSLISVVPYVGDAIGKTAKGARVAARIAKLKRRIETKIATINALKKKIREYAAAATRAKKKARKASQKVDDKVCKKCLASFDEAVDSPYGTRAPAKDKGFKGSRGNSTWQPDNSTSYGKGLRKWQEKHGKKFGIEPGEGIPYREGFPDFSKYVYKTKAGNRAGVQIKMTGNDNKDFAAANAAMRKIDKSWKKPPGWTWHHHEDGVTMQLIPTVANRVPHTGGASLTKNMPNY
ncbi:MAG: HNH endonuclease [Candidatus Thiosymbion ectosymbiont of Robbea hypermnestra]|nr:HNH endonuclease [Candidatus Thiosymbion ectosymbiont of Robbea hypermnestra]